MTNKNFKLKLDTLGIPVAYDHFPTYEHVNPPFIIFYNAYDNNFKADNKVYHTKKHTFVEFYSSTRDEATESLIEAILELYTKTIDYDDNQKLYITTYEVEL